MKKRILLVVSFIILAAILLRGCQPSQPIQPQAVTYRYYFPMAAKSIDTRFSVQGGWGENCCANSESILGLAHEGGDQHALIPGNQMQTIQTLGWYAAWGDSRGLLSHVCTYDTATRQFPQESECAQFIRDYPGTTWIIGNEPDCGTPCGFEYMTEVAFADFSHISIELIRANDSNVFIISAGWAGGICSGAAHNEENYLREYNARYGVLDVDALGLHIYQSGWFDNPYVIDRLNCFTTKAHAWQAEGWTHTDKIVLTEFGWNGNDPESNEPNIIRFMQWFIPQLKANPQVLRWHWWQWGEGSSLIGGGQATAAGQCYLALASGATCRSWTRTGN